MISAVSRSESPFTVPGSAGGWRNSLFTAARGRRHVAAALLVLAATVAAVPPSPAHADTWSQGSEPSGTTIAANPPKTLRLDHSGRKRVGMASYYARRFAGRKMADGTPMKPESDNAASRTLPLGTTAQVTNLRDGKTALVTIRDRGPYAKGRIIDLSPGTAKQLGIIHAGVVPVEITPMTVPQPNGSVKLVVALTEPEKANVQRRPL